MARTVNEQEYIAKRNEILNAVQRLIYSKGYERMTIGDILADLKISSGAFYHYFDSKPAVLDAYIERIDEESGKILLPVVNDSHLSAIEKLRGFFSALDTGRIALKADLVKLGRVWYNDDNAIVRQKVDEAVLQQRGALIARIVRQGVQEGVFTTPHPDQAGEVVMVLVQGMGDAHARLLLSLAQEPHFDRASSVKQILSTHAAYMEAIERVLGAPANCLYRADARAARVWLDALSSGSKAETGN
jgi:AcrR family transcriptional regulator